MRLERTLLLVVTLVLGMVPGCIVPEAPDLSDPERTPPFVRLSETIPTPGEVHTRSRVQGQPQLVEPLTIRVQSNDLGEALWMALHLDLGSEDHDFQLWTRYDPGTFDTPRDLTWDWEVPRTLHGCHRLTAIIAHASSFNTMPVDGLIRDDPEAQEDAEAITWTFYIIDDAVEEPAYVSECQR